MIEFNDKIEVHDILKGSVATALLFLSVNFVTPDEHKFIPGTKPQEPLICGLRLDVQKYVTDYTIDNNFVIDNIHGGVYNIWHCSPFSKQMPPDKAYYE